MEVFAKCARCGAMVGPCDTKETAGGTRMRFWAAATTCTVDTDRGMALDLGGATVLCPDCMGQLNKWLAGGQTKDLSIAEDIIMDMYAALGAEPQQVQACEYTTARRHEKCSECAFDPTQCVGEMFKSIRWRCAEIGIDLEGDEDAKQ